MASPIAQIQEQWRNLSTTNQRIAIVVAALLLVGVVYLVVRQATAPTYVQLYSNLTEEDASAVVQKLKEKRIDYRLNGTRIEVPQTMVDDLRLSLASEGIPRGGNVGFEIFDRTQFGQSEFGEQVNYQRALQGELSRTIGKLDCVQSANVLLVLPKDALYAEEKKRPTASVLLKLRRPATNSDIKAVIHLVSSSVEGLSPNDVRVVDASGRTLSDMVDSTGEGTTGTRLQAQRAVEADVERRVQERLDVVFGPGKSIVRATARMNFDKTKLDREVYSPIQGGTQGVLESEHKLDETYAKSGNGAMGTPGSLLGGSAPTATDNGYKRSETTNAYRVSKEVQHVETAPGQVERMSVSLLVDASIDPVRIAGLQQWLETDANLDKARGDQVFVTQMAFDDGAAKAEQAAAASKAMQDRVWLGVKIGGGILLALVFLLVLARIYRLTLAPVTAQIVGEEQVAGNGQYSMMLAERAIEQYAAMGQPGNGHEEQQHAVEEAQLASLDPQRVAIVIRNMITEEH